MPHFLCTLFAVSYPVQHLRRGPKVADACNGNPWKRIKRPYPSGQVIYSVPYNHGSAPPNTTNRATNTFGLYARGWLKTPLAYLAPSRGMRRALEWPALRLLKLP